LIGKTNEYPPFQKQPTMTEYKKNYKGITYRISHNFILDMENKHQIDLIKEMENILDDEIKRRKS